MTFVDSAPALEVAGRDTPADAPDDAPDDAVVSAVTHAVDDRLLCQSLLSKEAILVSILHNFSKILSPTLLEMSFEASLLVELAGVSLALCPN